MFEVGDRILYPMHGAGTIVKIEESEILGEKNFYYILKISGRDIKIMIPIKNSQRVGVRPVVSREEMRRAIEILGSEPTAMASNWNRRYRENAEKLKSGRVDEVAEVVRNLSRANGRKKLSAVENKMLTNARQILVSEVALVGDMDVKEASDLVEKAVKKRRAKKNQ